MKMKRLILFILSALQLFLFLFPVNVNGQALAENKDKFLGAASSGSVYRNFYKFWNQITPGNDGKWGMVEPSRDQFLWINLDKIYNYSEGADIPFKEHALIWGQQAPGWINSLDAAQQREEIEEWFQAVGERYPEMAYVDVVNEPFNAPPSFRDALGGEGATGWDWVITAFELAREYCPDSAKLILNEYNVLHDNNITTNYLTIINLLKERNLIDGIGIQGHYFEFRSDISGPLNYVHNIQTIKNNLNRLTATGIPVYITEFDIDEPDDANQLAQYKIYFPIFWENPGVKGITLWGYIQNDVWNSHPNTYLLRTNGDERPALQWLRSYIQSPMAPVLVSPVSETGVPRNPVLTWHSSESAESYNIQVSSNASFTSVIMDTVVTDTSIVLPALAENSSFYWRVNATNQHGTGSYSEAANFVTGDQVVAVKLDDNMPHEFGLFQNYPNPFNPVTRIDFTIPVNSYATLKVFSLLGEEVAVLAEGYLPSGKHTAEFNAKELAGGIYLYRLQAGSLIQTKKLVLLK